jgi:hypothetical protein
VTGRMIRPPMRDRIMLNVFLWAMLRQSVWRARKPSASWFYSWRGDTGPVVLITMRWWAPSGSRVSAEFRGSISAVLGNLITLTDTFERDSTADSIALPTKPEEI